MTWYESCDLKALLSMYSNTETNEYVAFCSSNSFRTYYWPIFSSWSVFPSFLSVTEDNKLFQCTHCVQLFLSEEIILLANHESLQDSPCWSLDYLTSIVGKANHSLGTILRGHFWNQLPPILVGDRRLPPTIQMSVKSLRPHCAGFQTIFFQTWRVYCGVIGFLLTCQCQKLNNKVER